MKTQCSHCNVTFNTGDKNIGKKAKCPKCNNIFTIEEFKEISPSQQPQPQKEDAPPPITTKTHQTPTQQAEEEPQTQAVNSPTTATQTPETTQQQTEEKPQELAPPAAPLAQKPQPQNIQKTDRKPASKALSKVLFIYCWIPLQIITAVVAIAGLKMALAKQPNSILLMVFAAADVSLILSLFIQLSLLYKMWASLQDGKASSSAGKAVGFLLIPVFNIYWALYIITGFVEDYNSFIKRNSIKAKELSFMPYVLHAFMCIGYMYTVLIPMICVLAAVGLIRRAYISYHFIAKPLIIIALIIGFLHFLSYIWFAIKSCNAVNELRDESN